MIAQKLIRNLLILFAGGSLLYVAAEEIMARRTAAGHMAVAPATKVGPETKLLVYYFAEGKNCTTCEKIPLYTKETLDANFAAEIASGAIAWQPVDVDEPRNEHFVSEFKIYTKSIVLVRVENGKHGRWKNLEAVWELVYDKPRFTEYIRAQVHGMLGGES